MYNKSNLWYNKRYEENINLPRCTYVVSNTSECNTNRTKI